MNYNEYDELVKQALKAQEHSYSPYSKFKVGAAILGESGKVYLGANIENASYGASICAERVACLKAIFDGEKSIKAVAVTCINQNVACYPCGICRQFLSEFGDPDIVVVKGTKIAETTKLSKLLPNAFSSNDM